MSEILLSGCIIIENNKILLLFREDHQHYETPGGHVKKEDCIDIKNPEVEELKKVAMRELLEEVKDINIVSMEYMAHISFRTPDKRKAVAHKFLTKIKGGPKINKDLFEYCDWLDIDELEEYPLSPDLILLLPEIRKLLKTT